MTRVTISLVIPGRKAWIYGGLTVATIFAGLVGRSLVNTAKAAPLAGDAPIPRAGGSLLICGGGNTPEEIRLRFLQLAGGPQAKIVVIPTAHAA